MKFPTRYSPPSEVEIDFSDSPSMTQQHFKDECDINNIVATYQQTGVLPTREGAMYGDFSGLPTNPLEAKVVFDEARANFMQLPSAFRKELDNDPYKFIEFISNQDNRQRCIELGIFNAPVPEPSPAPEPSPSPEPSPAPEPVSS